MNKSGLELTKEIPKAYDDGVSAGAAASSLGVPAGHLLMKSSIKESGRANLDRQLTAFKLSVACQEESILYAGRYFGGVANFYFANQQVEKRNFPSANIP